jgi:hypothetical protein
VALIGYKKNARGSGSAPGHLLFPDRFLKFTIQYILMYYHFLSIFGSSGRLAGAQTLTNSQTLYIPKGNQIREVGKSWKS